MSTIPVRVTEKQFMAYIRPVLSIARRGYECSIPLYKVFNYLLYRLHTGCQWERLPIERDLITANAEISWQAVYDHFRKWSRDGSLTKVWQESVSLIRHELDLSHLNLDGSHTLAKKGGETVAYQGRKKAKTSNILPITDGHGFVRVSTGLVAGNHHDAFDLKHHLQAAFKTLKRLKLLQPGAYFNADTAFDTRDARTTCFNYDLCPNIPENKRNRKTPSPAPNASSMPRSISNASPASGVLPGWISFGPYSSGLTEAILPFSPLTISPLPSSTCVMSFS